MSTDNDKSRVVSQAMGIMRHRLRNLWLQENFTPHSLMWISTENKASKSDMRREESELVVEDKEGTLLK